MKPTGYDAPITQITDEVFLTQSDPMKVLPPADDQIIGNQYGTVFMNGKTANKLLDQQCHYTRCKAFLDGTKRREREQVIAEVVALLQETGKYYYEAYEESGTYSDYDRSVLCDWLEVKVKELEEST